MSAESRGFACEIERQPIEVVPIVDGYDLRTLKCSRCGSMMKLVTPAKVERLDQMA
jgi:hypothetical protein